jgi:uncharacterized membrane protein YhaH (DUF805 family)
MGGLGEIFGFDGCIHRIGYLWRGLLVGIGLAALAAAGSFGLGTLRPDGIGDFQAWTQRVTMAVVLLGLWAGFALTTRRLRDLGLEPAHVVPAYAALWVINTELLRPMTQIEPQIYAPIETAWLVAQVLVVMLLLALPTRAPRSASQSVYAVAGQPTAQLDWRQSS